ncbi:MAG: hypothetical protein KAU14_00445, partial [Thermoplasmata archaeon]|nr:hypothetical protein [Thermoplasmata archaeon]
MKNIPTYKAALLSVLITVLLVSTSSFLAPPEKQSGSEYIDLDTNPVGSDDSNQTENPEPKNYIRIETDRDVYEKGENVTIRLFLVNALDEDVTYTFNNTLNCTYRWYMSISDSNGKTIKWIESVSYNTSNISEEATKIEIRANSEFPLEKYTWEREEDFEITGNGSYSIYSRLIGYDVEGM